ncbi:PDR/VanB family oxidoreductase [Actinomadura nitritigenes]|uniref:PDR/VanB family oxidoreductase n=1 Tax=Actinomadura nitritigenes TaxID=134602 RepID=UPI003D93FED8
MSEPVDDPEGVLELRVEQLRREADGVLSVTLADPEGGLLPAWEPGAHIDLELPWDDGGTGGAEARLVRQYSLCGDPADRFTYTVAVLREHDSSGGSAFVHDELRPGDLVEVGGPRNHFALVPAERYLFVAGGIGITPILPMIRAAEAAGTAWTLAYGGRRRETMAFLGDLAAHGDRVRVVVEAESGPLDLDAVLSGPREGTAVYCCGPAGLLDAVEARCDPARADDAWPEGALHIERFQAKAFDVDPARERPFQVVCARSEVTVQVPAGRSITDCLDGAGIAVPTACREGICGSCETKILDGVAEHRDSLLTRAEQEAGQTLMVCVSRARSERLVLDL